MPAKTCEPVKESRINTTNDLTNRILQHVSRKDYRPQRARRLAQSIGIEEKEYGEFRAAVKSLMKAGRVILGGRNCVMLPSAVGVIIGTFRGNPRGFGFVVPANPTDHGDLFIPPGAAGGAITGDTVEARITRRGKRGDSALVEGEVTRIIERGQSRFVGELIRQGEQWLMIPDGHALHAPVIVGDVGSTRARTGDQVVVELTEFPSATRAGRGVIIEVLGRRSDPGVDTLSIIHQYHLRHAFPPEVADDVRHVVRKYALETELGSREDLRREVVVTIDPDDAKDFDDAISIRRSARGRYELGVHIADVSAFVRPDSPLDVEARLRGNSVYFPRHVIPMLPEVLSNGLCSLQEGEPRLAKSVFIEYDTKGRRIASRFANTVIQSHKRLTYREVTRVLAGETRGVNPQVVALLKSMEHLARLIQKRRLAAGMIVLDLPGVELIVNDGDEVIDVIPEDTAFAHTIIEMFMVEANEAVAELFHRLGVPHLRRIHPEPPAESQNKLTGFLRVLGKPVPKRLERSDMIRLLDSVRGQPEAFAVNLAVLRSMAQAEYSPAMIGHFALASRHYTHFTSPIRRYPDLVVHRLLQQYLEHQLDSPQGKSRAPSSEELAVLGAHCSFTERNAEAAEREIRLVKILRFLEKRVGDIEQGVVTGVANVGVYVQLLKYRVDGLVRFADLPDDWWDIDVRSGCVVGQRSRKRIAIGDAVNVQLAGVDLSARELDLVLTADSLKTGTGRARPSVAKRGEPDRGRKAARVERKTVRRRDSRRPRRIGRRR
ncbi:MAG TPA: ribonuclease R [Phycisphaerae bacterium]|nr:ribonuclease R [Phycisphaerae bacterium]HRR84100.1 ribonuclease R [Phycisphaerae bacterium]